MSGAPVTTKVPGGWVSHVLVRFEPGGGKDAEPEISIYVKNDAEVSGYLKIRLNGEPIAVNPA
ncbi:hypothetical protein ACFVAV_15560 [Nocardia sp. NPDC057663]|uniref:hypothetical protein n=1 Tax=Nocardia sp. NPDC057663 TaxID=3346201 RepID=UPI003670844B